jgi:hypothetical protein
VLDGFGVVSQPQEAVYEDSDGDGVLDTDFDLTAVAGVDIGETQHSAPRTTSQTKAGLIYNRAGAPGPSRFSGDHFAGLRAVRSSWISRTRRYHWSQH